MTQATIQMTPGDDTHLTLLMAPQSLNFVTGQDREHLLAFGRAAFEAGQASKCLHQIAEPAATQRTGDFGRAALEQYLQECKQCQIVPDVGGAFAYAWLHAAAPQAVQPAAPVTAASIEAAAHDIAIAVAKNCGSVPQLTFPGIYLGLKDFAAYMLAATAHPAEGVPAELIHAAHAAYEFLSSNAAVPDNKYHVVTSLASAFAATQPAALALRDVSAERVRQIELGYDQNHDDEHCCEEIAAAAAVFIMPEECRDWDASSTTFGETIAEALLPCDWGAPEFGNDRRAQLVKGAAMAIAEIERIDRAALAAQAKQGSADHDAH